MPPQETTQKKYHKKWWIYGLALVLLSPVVYGAVQSYYLTKAPADAAENFFQQLSSGQIDAAYNSGSQVMHNAMARDDFNKMLERFPALTSVESQSFSSRAIKSDGTAEISGTLTARDGRTIMIVVKLEKVDGVWKVMAFLPLDFSEE